ncbi:MAG: hypothetical protein AB1478_11265 [Nitrospirota bacterium]
MTDFHKFIIRQVSLKMPNKIVFNINGETREVGRKFLEDWYTEENPYDYDYDLMKQELSRTTIKDLAELYIDNELSDTDLEVTYELIRDPEDTDVADDLMRDMWAIYVDLRWMIQREDLLKFLDGLIRGLG